MVFIGVNAMELVALCLAIWFLKFRWMTIEYFKIWLQLIRYDYD